MFQAWLVNANLTLALVRWNKNWTYWVQVCGIFGEKWVKLSTQNWKVKHEGGSMMFFSTSGVSHLGKVDGIMNKGHYIQIWDEKIHLAERRPQHVSMLAKKWFFGNNANILEWPCQSPDQNPIKNLWRTKYNRRMKISKICWNLVMMHENWQQIKVFKLRYWYKSFWTCHL